MKSPRGTKRLFGFHSACANAQRKRIGAKVSECPQCHGSTWKIESVPGKRDPSRPREVAVRCDCFYDRRKEQLLRAARIPERYTGGFGDYQIDFQGGPLERARFTAAKMVQEYPAEK